LQIYNYCAKKHAETLSCQALLRDLRGVRSAYRALWENRPVIVKVFEHRFKAGRHMRREWQGLRQLERRGVSAPRGLFYGRSEAGRPVVVVEEIAESVTAVDVFRATHEPAARLDILTLVCRELAQQNEKGILQKDLHLGNFLLAGERVYTLDPAQMRFYSRPVGRKASLVQLAKLACSLPACDGEGLARLQQIYAASRGWRLSESERRFVKKSINFYRRKTIRNALRKTLGAGKRYLRIQRSNYVAVVEKDFLSEPQAVDFAERIDSLIDAGQVLKKGNTSYVSRIAWNGRNVVVKRYNHKGLIHSLRHTIKGSRARRGWLHGHRLGMLNIATARPLAYIERRWLGMLWCSFLITEYVEGRNLHEFLQMESLSEKQRSMVLERLKRLLVRLGEQRITHSDLKPSNILMAGQSPTIIDLDAMKVHWPNLTRAGIQRKNLERFDRCVKAKLTSSNYGLRKE